MLDYIEHSATPRQFRLFACGCCRLVWRHLPKESRIAVETAERLADSVVSYSELLSAIELFQYSNWHEIWRQLA